MTVSELISELEELPQDDLVTIKIGIHRTIVDDVDHSELCEEVVLS